MKRLLAFVDPWADPQGIGYHAIQSMMAIAGGNRGLGNGIQKQGYLPADTTDFLFAVICEELGLAGAGRGAKATASNIRIIKKTVVIIEVAFIFILYLLLCLLVQLYHKRVQDR